eukprot:CAMPEP_0175960700 /NCGR_PEP_ID=MMETSP0108-20121206/35519_1 /TAXON_ID=195067 ORGANISM="Goniomonas pacifica, Strain CCMP1869" /NCGR_SAMPLE_ID=MMETSP0108 /ASSEMBLY_ACC=CAM_ASM_000204 /LENGTH=142 /DNA_ID=CAMNT_0017288335 /DNA_START=223 /DNA_END=653 /DNA_ORIENTATION=-
MTFSSASLASFDPATITSLASLTKSTTETDENEDGGGLDDGGLGGATALDVAAILTANALRAALCMVLCRCDQWCPFRRFDVGFRAPLVHNMAATFAPPCRPWSKCPRHLPADGPPLVANITSRLWVIATSVLRPGLSSGPK